MIEDRKYHIENKVSDRKFGISMFAILMVLSLLDWKFSWYPYIISICAATILLILVLVKPHWLKPLNQAWFRLGFMLQKITTPLILAAMFYLILTPTAWFFRWAGKSIKSRFRPGAAKSYWTENTEPSTNFKQIF